VKKDDLYPMALSMLVLGETETSMAKAKEKKEHST
jgi:hypothetical protein